MGIYWWAVDETEKAFMEPPNNYGDKIGAVCYPGHPLPGMIVMMNSRGYHFQLVNDMSYETPEDYEDWTDKVWKEYRERYKEFYDKEGN